MAEIPESTNSRAVAIADQVVPAYRAKGARYSCTGQIARCWQAAHDGALAALAPSVATPADDAGVPKIGVGRYSYATVDQLSAMLRAQLDDVLHCECEPHVVAEAWDLVRMAADELEARLAPASASIPADVEREAIARAILDGWYEGNESWERLHNDMLHTRAYWAADAVIALAARPSTVEREGEGQP